MEERVTRISTHILWVVEKKYRTKNGTVKKYRRPVVRFPYPRTILNKLGINVKNEPIRVIVEIYDDGSFRGYIPKSEVERILKKQYPTIDELR